MNSKLNISKDKIADFCQRNCIRKLAFFGSVLRDDFGSDEDQISLQDMLNHANEAKVLEKILNN